MSQDAKKFFIIVPPGFEPLATRELQLRGYAIAPATEPIRGGLEVELPLENGYRINQDSHIATRVLERLGKWRCRDFPKLFNKTQTLTWEKWVTGPIEIDVSAHRSRLMNKKRIAETVEKGIAARLKKSPAKKSAVKRAATDLQKIFVRFNNDEVEMSLDTSGQALFKRGYKTMAEAAAPIRENLAAAVFWAVYEQAGRPAHVTVLDPNCGTGTLLTEAAGFFTQKPRRSYAYETWFGEAQKKTPASPCPAILPQAKVNLIGFDRDQDALMKAKENAAQLGVEIRLSQTDFLKTSAKDVRDVMQRLDSSGSLRIGLANPPYGERIQWPVPPRQFYSQLIEFFKNAECQLYGFIVPRQKVRELPRAPYKIDFENGGILVSLVVYGSAGGEPANIDA